MTNRVTTLWLTYSDPTAPTDKRFLGVAIFDMDESSGQRTVPQIVRRARELGINPGGVVSVQDVTGDPRITEADKNRLITDDALLLRLGSRGRKLQNMN